MPVTTTTANAHHQPEQTGLPDLVQVESGAERESEEGDHHRNGARQEIAHFAVEIADQHADRQRQDGADQRRRRKRGETGDTERQHGQERSGLK